MREDLTYVVSARRLTSQIAQDEEFFVRRTRASAG